MTRVDLTVTGPVLTGSNVVLISNFFGTGEITLVILPRCLLHCTGGIGSPVTVHLNTAKVDWLRTEPVGERSSVTFG